MYLLDVRTLPEYAEDRLEFTDDLISYELVPDSLDRLPADKSSLLYLFCRSGHRSGIVTQYLREKGYTGAFNVSGGIVAWKAAGYETISGQ
jgi:rhodanese-related sulfurtransferase